MQEVKWSQVAVNLLQSGYAVVPEFLTGKTCRELIDRYPDDSLYHRHVVMERHGFGAGAYKYYAYPLPDLIESLRKDLYPPLARIANDWNRELGEIDRYPDDHARYLRRCQEAKQLKPTPLILEYGEGGYNCLHQDIYGEEAFPLQVAILLSEPENHFAGGEFVLTEQQPRMQSKVQVVSLRQGDAVIFPVRSRPCRGKKKWYRVNMRHGVSPVTFGQRYSLGIIFHDAQ